jgi:hypothetical protein
MSSTLSGERVTIQAGKDIRIEGSDVVSSTGTRKNARMPRMTMTAINSTSVKPARAPRM